MRIKNGDTVKVIEKDCIGIHGCGESVNLTGCVGEATGIIFGNIAVKFNDDLGEFAIPEYALEIIR